MLRQWQSLHLAKTTLADLVNASNATRAKNAREKPQLSAAPLDLPHFNSGQLVAQLNAVAKDAGLALNKVVYVLEESGNQPYLRYRITLSSTMKYPVVRGFAEQLDGSIPHLSFDAIACARKEISVVELSCDLVMSGFFRKQSDG